MPNTELISYLMDLGLTEYEAKTLATLFKMKEAEAPEISRMAQVPKTRVYDVLERLMNKKLVIEIYGRPKKYRVVDAQKVFDELLAIKKAELKALEEKAELLKKYSILESEIPKSSERVMKVKNKNDFLKIVSQEIEKAKNSVVGFGDISNEHCIIGEALKAASRKNVEIKLISKISGLDKIVKDYGAEGIEIKGSDHGMRAFVIDNKKVILGLSNFDEEKPEYHFTIWEDNKALADAMMMYFNQCWQKSQKIE